VKRSGIDEPIWIAIHKCMEAMLGISLYSSLSQANKNAMSFLIISDVFSSTKSENKRAEHVLSGSVGG
jgi:hypothetical protein